jgi:hypothetical protein
MKIIYLFTSPFLKGSSVQTKVLNQIKYLNIAGADCRGAFFSTEVKEVTKLNEYVDLIPVEKCTWKYFRASGQIRKTMLAVIKFANTQYQETNFFYFRYPGAGSLLNHFTKNFGYKTLFEHLSIEEAEIELSSNENPFGLRPSKILSRLEYYWLPFWREKLYGKSIRRYAKLGICNSQEIAEFQIKKSGNKYKTIVGGDSVNVIDFPLKTTPIFDKELRMIFLKGASTKADFNGLDRLINGIKNYSGVFNIKFYILGHQLKAESDMIDEVLKKNIILLPAIKGIELSDFMRDIHIGVATLGVFRKKLNSTTTIKAREYFAQGLPFIYAYTDPDLNEDSKEWSLQFPNDDSLIDMQNVIDFAQKVLLDPQHPQKMRQYAERHLDFKVKMENLLQHLTKLKD